MEPLPSVPSLASARLVRRAVRRDDLPLPASGVPDVRSSAEREQVDLLPDAHQLLLARRARRHRLAGVELSKTPPGQLAQAQRQEADAQLHHHRDHRPVPILQHLLLLLRLLPNVRVSTSLAAAITRFAQQ